jgi:hypothetical protein
MEPTEKQIKDLKMFSKLLNSLNMEDGVTWYYQCYEGEFEPLYGPTYHGRGNISDELTFLPGSIEEFFETIRDNFDTGNFYNEYYDTENGSLTFTIYANRNELDVMYDYYQVNTEESHIEKEFSYFSDSTPTWRGHERDAKKLSDPAVVEELKSEYGDSCNCTYDGSGDSGWVSDEVRCSKGRLKLNEQLERICYDLLELYYGGWEINEGSNGSIDFNFEDQIVDLYHNQNVEENIDEHYMTWKF